MRVAMSMALPFASLAAAVTLAVITWIYTRATQALARTSLEAVDSAKLAAQAAVIQGLLASRANMLIRRGQITAPLSASTSNKGVGPTPLAVDWSVKNVGSGEAFDVRVKVSIGGRELV